MLSKLVTAFLPRSMHLLISWLQLPSAVILEPPKIKSLTLSIVSPSICHEVMGSDAMILVFWMLNFKPTFSLSSFTFIKRPFSSSLLSAIRVVSSAYLRLLTFLPTVLIPACTSSSLAFCMMYSAYKLNMQGDNIQPWCTPFPIWNQSVVPCQVLTVASCPVYRFLKRQVRWSNNLLSIICLFIIYHLFLCISLWNWNLKRLISQSSLTLCGSMDCSPPGSSVHRILQARILEWVAMLSSRGSSPPRDQTHVSYISCIGKQVLHL